MEWCLLGPERVQYNGDVLFLVMHSVLLSPVTLETQYLL